MKQKGQKDYQKIIGGKRSMSKFETWEEFEKTLHFTPEEDQKLECELKKERVKIEARIKKEETKRLKKEKKLLKSLNYTKSIQKKCLDL